MHIPQISLYYMNTTIDQNGHLGLNHQSNI